MCNCLTIQCKQNFWWEIQNSSWFWNWTVTAKIPAQAHSAILSQSSRIGLCSGIDSFFCPFYCSNPFSSFKRHFSSDPSYADPQATHVVSVGSEAQELALLWCVFPLHFLQILDGAAVGVKQQELASGSTSPTLLRHPLVCNGYHGQFYYIVVTLAGPHINLPAYHMRLIWLGRWYVWN